MLQTHRGDRQGRRTAAHAGELTRLSISVNRSRRAAHRSASLRPSLPPQLPAPGNRCRQRVRGNTATPTAAEIPRPTIVGLPLDGNDPGIPILLAMSDDGPRCAPAPPGSSGAVLDRRSLRPARHPDRPSMDPVRSRQRRVAPPLDTIRKPAMLAAELEIVRDDHNGRRQHAGIGYVTPTTRTPGAAGPSARPRRDGPVPARTERLAHHRSHDQQNRPRPPPTVD